ncbi:unnamed protein product [Acanthoscelides obtectus]|uniref:Uncharacterized protein n=1 Tax=Acanthoscelides obtectus TaxID=200917 RepID=A0A9P0JUF3_ACAOB|nr:unnamed protein product [Acanthoscelides obtectus]CAK1663726.1 hypothetical protein AOBTE_LOCUS23825 [Acanthoscelides obtectus]
MSENRKKLTDKELEYYANHLSEISDGSVDFDSDDSIADPDFCSGSEISSEQSESDQEIDSDSDDIGFAEFIHQNEEDLSLFWLDCVLQFKKFQFTGTQGTLIPIEGKDVRDIYKSFLTDEIIQLMVQQTNDFIRNHHANGSYQFSNH